MRMLLRNSFFFVIRWFVSSFGCVNDLKQRMMGAITICLPDSDPKTDPKGWQSH
jgi:hypothetical protein